MKPTSMVRHPGVIVWAAIASVLTAGRLAHAEVTAVGTAGFEVREQMHVAAGPDIVWATLLAPARWWDREHTYSGDAQRLTLEPRVGGCWCETLPGGGAVEHMVIVYLAPGKAVRFRGGLGPLQAMGVAGSLTVTLTPGSGGTDVKFAYAVGGYSKDGFENISKAVDGVLGSQVARLKEVVEKEHPNGAAH